MKVLKLSWSNFIYSYFFESHYKVFIRYLSHTFDFLLMYKGIIRNDKNLTCSTQTFVVITWFFKSYEYWEGICIKDTRNRILFIKYIKHKRDIQFSDAKLTTSISCDNLRPNFTVNVSESLLTGLINRL